MDIVQLEENFAIPGHLAFEEHNGLIRMQVHLESAAAIVYLHGAHVTHWQPAGQAPAIFLSDQSEFAPAKAIRGGVPICFPWFGPRSDGKPGPAHGFARIQDWELAFAALLPGEAGDRMQLTFTLGPGELSRSLGFDSFRAVYEVTVGTTLTLRLTVANTGAEPLHIEEALHSYFAVGDVRNIELTGLESARYLDKTDRLQEKTTPAGPLALTGETDRVFPANTATVTIHDEANSRIIRVEKTGSATTVVWNPWSVGAARISDLPDDAWPGFVCIEAANTATDAITLAPGETHMMQAAITVIAA
jgi:glucose-6-phosphate 1-epimerase